ncbi:hypothetical protein H310_07388 [Aphanomyces invadans]|uniref:Uncharacterized protein n=1 Tax=Aphanomyces invadans TaxID=157072 RepID=A0A024U385_9STRA|nr:hypothetical protein H310_07388 [Aphanomyces invadans]ETW00866.1 hypothetical protein H310_07388 [Aphanomyces invadans]|eukprot:XP_008871001.1 hypothetical protein H310_07388 [Aphanomyces invadans]
MVHIINGEIVQDNDPRVLNRKAKTGPPPSANSTSRQGGFHQSSTPAATPQPGTNNPDGNPLSQLATAIGCEGTVVIPAFPAMNLRSVVVEKIYFVVLAVLIYMFGARALVLAVAYYFYLTQQEVPATPRP